MPRNTVPAVKQLIAPQALAIWLLLTCGFTGAFGQTAKPQAEPRHALVIGISAYQQAPLRNPVNDANAMATALTACGFTVDLLTNASKPAIEAATNRLHNALSQGGVGLFYFAGHGLQINGQNYLLPVEVDSAHPSQLEQRCISANQVLTTLENAQNRLNILILDACRINPFTNDGQVTGTAPPGLAPLYAATQSGSFIAYATAPGRLSSDGHGANGLYTAQLLKVIRQPGLPLEETFKQVRLAVVNASDQQQVPWESTSVIGDFYFNPDSAPPLAHHNTAPPSAPHSAATTRPASPLAPLPDMATIPAGDFITGPTGGWQDERPITRQYLNAFRLDRHEVSVRQYRQFIQSQRTYKMPQAPAHGFSEDHPIRNISWQEAQAYCAWRGKRLPTEVEWEKAARGTDGRRYPWGDQAPQPQYANLDFSATATDLEAMAFGSTSQAAGPVAVNALPAGASPYGVLHLMGNVWEWTASTAGKMRMVRGGAWDYAVEDPQSPFATNDLPREKHLAKARRSNLGFRCAQ